MKFIRYAILFFMLVTLSSCVFVKDTCNGGLNMSNPRVVGGFDASLQAPQLVITWDTGTGRGAELPDRYFAEVMEGSLLKDVTFNSNPKSITMTFEPLDMLTTDALEVSLTFPDRRGFIDCQHSGAPDRYNLDITLNFSEKKFVGAVFTESVRLGPF